MSNHGLTRNPENETICLCGYRPDIWDQPAPVGKQWKAKSMILAHAAALTPQTNILTAMRSPWDPFPANHVRRFPRAGVRRTGDGKWIVTLWDDQGVMHAWENPGNAEHHNRIDAFEFAHWFIKVHHDLGVSLSGMAHA